MDETNFCYGCIAMFNGHCPAGKCQGNITSGRTIINKNEADAKKMYENTNEMFREEFRGHE